MFKLNIVVHIKLGPSVQGPEVNAETCLPGFTTGDLA